MPLVNFWVVKNNSGVEGGAVNVWHTYDTRGKAQSVTFEKCSFTNNNADDGTVLVEGGKLTLKESLFSNNKGVSFEGCLFMFHGI